MCAMDQEAKEKGIEKSNDLTNEGGVETITIGATTFSLNTRMYLLGPPPIIGACGRILLHSTTSSL